MEISEGRVSVGTAEDSATGSVPAVVSWGMEEIKVSEPAVSVGVAVDSALGEADPLPAVGSGENDPRGVETLVGGKTVREISAGPVSDAGAKEDSGIPVSVGIPEDPVAGTPVSVGVKDAVEGVGGRIVDTASNSSEEVAGTAESMGIAGPEDAVEGVGASGEDSDAASNSVDAAEGAPERESGEGSEEAAMADSAGGYSEEATGSEIAADSEARSEPTGSPG